jgi:hypothetical protein
MILAHLWLLSPSLGRKVYGLMSAEWREEVVAALKGWSKDNDTLFLPGFDDLVALFGIELAEKEPAVATWLASEASGEIGERARSASSRLTPGSDGTDRDLPRR